MNNIHLSKIPLTLYQVFHEVAKTGSMTAASESLFVTQSAVSHSIRKLEEALGCELFERIGRKIVLTEQGRLLMRHTEKIFDELRRFEDDLTVAKESRIGRVSIACAHMPARYVLNPVLENFHRAFPEVRMHTRAFSLHEVIERVQNREVDFGIVISPFLGNLDTAKVTYRPIVKFRDAFIAGGAFADLRDRTVPLRELVDFPLIGMTQGLYTRNFQNQFFHRYGLQFEPKLTSDFMDLMLDMAARNMGIAFAADFCLHVLQQNHPEVFAMKIEEPLPEHELGIVVSKSKSANDAAQTLVDWLTGADVARATPFASFDQLMAHVTAMVEK